MEHFQIGIPFPGLIYVCILLKDELQCPYPLGDTGFENVYCCFLVSFCSLFSCTLYFYLQNIFKKCKLCVCVEGGISLAYGCLQYTCPWRPKEGVTSLEPEFVSSLNRHQETQLGPSDKHKCLAAEPSLRPLNFLLILCMYLFGVQRTTCVISFHICPGDPAQVTGLGSKCLYPLSHLSDCLISMHKKAFRSYSGLQEDNYLFPICVLPFISQFETKVAEILGLMLVDREAR